MRLKVISRGAILLASIACVAQAHAVVPRSILGKAVTVATAAAPQSQELPEGMDAPGFFRPLGNQTNPPPPIHKRPGTGQPPPDDGPPGTPDGPPGQNPPPGGGAVPVPGSLAMGLGLLAGYAVLRRRPILYPLHARR